MRQNSSPTPDSVGPPQNQPEQFGWPEVVAAIVAVGLALAMPSPVASAPLATTPDDEDWNFLWVKPADAFEAAGSGIISPALSGRLIGYGQEISPVLQSPIPTLASGAISLSLQPLAETTFVGEKAGFVNDTASSGRGLSYRIAYLPIGVRTTPAMSNTPSLQPSVALREDHWTMVDVDGLMRLTAYARGTLEHEDMSLVRAPSSFPRALGTGVGFVTSTPIYVGAAIKTDRSIYDIDLNRFDGARWSTSVFMGTETSFGPLYLGTTKDARGTRGAYLYLGRWF